nr:hypothetical protein [uncultured Draconibacterium sp.]
MNRIFKKKISAGILPLTLSVSLILALFCMAAILLAYYSNLLWVQTKNSYRLELNAHSALEYILNNKISSIPLNTSLSTDLFGDGRDSVTISKKAWGIFNLLSIEAYSNKSKHNTNQLIAYVGGQDNLALYVCNRTPTAITLAGNTEIKGNVWIPSKGIKAGTYNRIGFSGSELVLGKTLRSEFKLPKLDEEINLKLQEVFSLLYSKVERVKKVPEKMENSFNNQVKILFSQEPIIIQSQLKGNIIVVSELEIEIDADSNLDNIILVAPVIKFKSGFKGCVQAFAGKFIDLASDVKLLYPSALITSSTENSQIRISENVIIQGVIFQSGDTNLNSNIFISSGSRIEGQVITNGSIEHHGTVYGQILCSSFEITDNSGQHPNYLFNAVVDRFSLSETYLFPGILASDMQRPEIITRLQ